MFVAAFRSAQSAIGGVFGILAVFYENSLFAATLFAFLNLDEPNRRAVPTAQPSMPEQRGCSIEFVDVSYKYPQTNEWAIKDVSLRIEAGSRIALVGENGAGKTTLIKLMTGLYAPTEGKVLLDGKDASNFSCAEISQIFQVSFQDFVQFQMSAYDNILLGNSSSADRESVIASAETVNAREFIEQLSNGFDTTLGAWFEGATDLSGGQWQKISLARALMGSPKVLVLDEPTASLDPQSEFDVFQHLASLTRLKGQTVVLISHRFWTVASAETIFFLKDGMLAEYGSHEELMDSGGDYQSLFELQSSLYPQADT
jgi:ATP-binding cassette subfamily B protein